jgi:hypothetical protein
MGKLIFRSNKELSLKLTIIILENAIKSIKKIAEEKGDDDGDLRDTWQSLDSDIDDLNTILENYG